ncbi:GtrA family protein [Microbacterium karelineae]|uniref:GtrA family protein n=1 Tax=Microbacterium karelineae TaxID=2654283 RepID=UPI0018D31BDA|nr:GtrA family protein [Microbacterium karelineae]
MAEDQQPEGEVAGAVGGMAGPDGPLLRLFRDRRIAFLAVGGINTGVGFVWFILFSLAIDTAAPGAAWADFAVIASAQVASSISAFFLYRHLVFRVTGHFWLDLARFQLVYVVIFPLNLIVVPALTLGLGWNRIVAQLLFTVVYVALSWFGHSRFSFHRRKEE